MNDDHSATCLVCGSVHDESETEVIPDGRVVCGNCARRWSEACEVVIERHRELIAEVDDYFITLR